MALEVGAAVLSSVLSVLFDRMASRPVLDFIRGHKVTAGLLQKLKLKLLSVTAVLDDAEEKQIRNPIVRKWLDELKDALHHAEDLLDEIKTEALRRKVEEEESGSSSTRQVHNITSPSLHELDKTLEPRILEILERLELIVSEKDVLGLKEDVKDSLHAYARLPTTSLPLGEDSVFGREKEKDNIIKLLLADDVTGNKISVIPIVGLGGIGKTTLAQLVYNNDRVQQHFHLRAWVCVSEEFDVVKITQTICGSVTSGTCDHITDLDRLQVNLKEALTGKKFLFVLDDVWKVNHSQLDLLTRPFENGSHGSKIIVTTRIDDVASRMGTLGQIHRLEQISEDHCWLIFAKHALQNAGVNTHPDLEVVGRQIVTKCKGLPLAAKSLGSLLRSKLDPEEWEKILKSEIWELSDMEILPALWLSYHYLPPHLKRCFMYCSIFPKDYVFEKSKLILMWMAEDLLQPKNKNITMEETGEEYFNDLMSRSFFQRSECLFSSGFIMHDLVNDLAKFLSREFCVRLENNDDFVNIVSKTRHFSYMKGLDSDGSEKLEALYEAKHLHTFLPLPSLNVYGVLHDLLPALQYLRLINLSRYDIGELPNSIGSLKHLRYLDLSYSGIQKLPETMCTLYNLQTLLLDWCRDLAELPTNFGRLISLRHLNIRRYRKLEKMPPHMGRLRDLQTLEGEFVLDKHTGRNIAELKELKSLRGQLYISGLHNIVRAEDALEANMRDKKYLNQLFLAWGGDTEDSKKDGEVLANLQPHTNLKILTILSYGGTRFPGWLGDHSSSNLVSLKLEKCEYCFFLPPLGQLPSLRELEIIELNGVVSIGPEFYGDDTCGIRVPFRSLQVLKFKSMREWQEWSYVGGNQEGGAFPNLCELELRDCPKLSGRFPLDYFPKLEKLRIWYANVESLATSQCPKLLISLTKLDIQDCPNLVCFPDGGLQAPNLTKMKIRFCEKLRSLPEEMHTLLPSLETMRIQHCPELESFPEGGLPSKLRSLEIFECKKLRSLPEEMHTLLPSLETINIYDCPELESFPEGGIATKIRITYDLFLQKSDCKAYAVGSTKIHLSQGFPCRLRRM